MYGPAIPVDIGYCFNDDKGAFAFEPPRPVIARRDRPMGLRAVQNCPAVNQIERQLIEICSPIALRIALLVQDGELKLQINPTGTFARPQIVQQMLTVEPPERWRSEKVPVLQLRLPFFFVTDEPCWCTLLPPFLGAEMRRWPGTMVAGRYPVSDWPQDISWAIEWDALNQELIIRQGDVLAYAMFDFDDQAKRPNLVEARLTDELTEYRAGMDGVHHITPEIEAIWRDAAARRPAQLLRAASDVPEPAA